MTTSISYAAFCIAYRAILFDEWRQLAAAGYLTEQGLLAIRTRLMSNEFKPTPDRDLLLMEVNAAYAAKVGIDVATVPAPPTLTVPDDPSQLDAESS
jgi:hypothetical protein